MPTEHMTARCQTFGDYGAPGVCWDAWTDGGAKWTEHLRYCQQCRATEAKRQKDNTKRRKDNAP